LSGDAFRGFVQQESAKWAQLIREANIKVD
jgi:tripartite-type tricarboxylate transporter receptor subunit TctC